MKERVSVSTGEAVSGATDFMGDADQFFKGASRSANIDR
jgi:hypothetical protein